MSEGISPESQVWLEKFVEELGGVAGTVHVTSGPEELTLVAAVNIPEVVLKGIGTLEKGKGMAGSTFAAGQDVGWSNFKTDTTGRVKSGAQFAPGKGAATLLVRDAEGEIRAVVGISFAGEKDFSEEELADLKRRTDSLP